MDTGYLCNYYNAFAVDQIEGLLYMNLCGSRCWQEKRTSIFI